MTKRKKKSPWARPEPAAILEQARELRTENGPKQHHLVPAFYLKGWCEDRRLRVADLDEKRTFVTSPSNAAKQSQYYTVASDDLDPHEVPPLLMEAVLSDLEGHAAPLLRTLAEEPSHLTKTDLAHLSLFLGNQWVRGATVREALRASTNWLFKTEFMHLTADDDVRSYLKESGAPCDMQAVTQAMDFLDQLRNGTGQIEPQKAALVGMAFQHAWGIGACLSTRRWVVYKTPPMLLTNDEPVTPLDGPGGRRGQRGGAGIAGIVIFPLRPDRLLVLARSDLAPIHSNDDSSPVAWARAPLSHGEVAAINRDLCAHAYRFTFERPSQGQSLRMPTPTRGPAFQDEEVLGYSDDNEGILFRMFTPNRWADSSVQPPWPINWWWPGRIRTPSEFARDFPDSIPDADDWW